MKPAPASSSMETRIVTAAEVTVWLESARPGDSLVYCTGPAMLAGPTQEKLARLIRAGKVRAHKRRAAGSGELEHYLVVQAGRAPIEATVSVALDEAGEKILEALERCVRRRRRAYSNQELARIAGLATRHQADWRVRKLAMLGRISIETRDGPDGTPWRVVTIDGKATMAPPGRAREVDHAD